MAIDILLVHPLFLSRDPVEQRLMTPYFPLGLLYLAATLRDAGYAVAIFDGTFASGPNDLIAVLENYRPRVVGFSVLVTERSAALELAALARARGIRVVMGGADPTGRPDIYLGTNEAPFADVVVIGEGEETLLELLPTLLGEADARPLPEIRGLAYRDETGQMQRTPPRPLRRDIDAIPWPARDMVDLDHYQRAWRDAHGYSSLSLIASRGCPFECAWCQKSVFGRSCRLRDPEQVAQEMAHLKARYRPDQVRIVDDVVGIDRKWVKAFRDAILAHDAVIPFECLSRVDLADREVLSWLREAGCFRISYGAESGSQKVLDAMCKGTRVEQIRQAAQWCHELGIEVYFYIMLGYPGEEWADIQATAQLLRETLPEAFSSTVAYPLAGTPFYEQVRDRLVEAADWVYTAENRVLYRGRYSTRFYRWAQRWLHKEWQIARLKGAHLSAKVRLRLWAGLWISRAVMYGLRWMPADLRGTPGFTAH